MTELKQTPLNALHRDFGARMVEFAGYEMPVQFSGVMDEHLHVRSEAGLFDVSHMGQVRLAGAAWEEVALALETLVPQDVLGLQDGRQRYAFFTNEQGGIEDDLMISRHGDELVVVVNAACKEADLARLQTLAVSISLESDQALLALQGPA
ncbi:MAG: glycine cleavage system aminomethyltransferase GcvT, partial [Pseudomonadota bacterium]